VCRRWREVGEDPRLWRGLTLRVQGWRGRGEEALASRRLQAITSCHLKEVSTPLLEAVASHPTLTSLAITYPAQLAPLAPGLLAATLGAMEEVAIQGAFLPSLHSRQLMATIGRPTTTIRRLHLAIDLSTAEAELLAGMVRGLEELELPHTHLTRWGLAHISAHRFISRI